MWWWFNSHVNCTVLEPAGYYCGPWSGKVGYHLQQRPPVLDFIIQHPFLGLYAEKQIILMKKKKKQRDFYNSTHLYLWSFPLSSCDCFKVAKQNGIFSFLYKTFLCIGFGDIILVISGWFVIWKQNGPKVRLPEMQWNF